MDTSGTLPTPYFSRETTNFVKGVALVLMFVHHFFTFPGELLNPELYPWIDTFAFYFTEPTKICVCIFAFLTGYFYSFSKEKTYRNSLRKILDVLIPYWAVMLVLVPFSQMAGQEFGLKQLLQEAMLLNTSLMIFCWYVRFYVVVMLILPLLVKLARENVFASFLGCLVFPEIAWYVMASVPGLAPLRMVFEELATWFPCVAMGFLFGHHDLFRRWLEPTGKPRFQGISALGLFLLVFLGRYFLRELSFGTVSGPELSIMLYFTLDIVYAPLAVYALVRMMQCIKKPGVVLKMLGRIGQMSMLMWFLHCGFFNGGKTILQPILYFPRNPVLVTLWGLALCYAAAKAIDFVCRPVLRWKNQLVQKVLQ